MLYKQNGKILFEPSTERSKFDINKESCVIIAVIKRSTPISYRFYPPTHVAKTAKPTAKLNKLYQNIEDSSIFPVGSIIKIGRVALRLVKTPWQSNEEKYKQIKLTSNEEKRCRFCYDDSNSLDNPLVNICACAGSIAFIHVHCCRKWIYSNVTEEVNDQCIITRWSKLRCNLCMQKLPMVVKINQNKHDLILPEIDEECIEFDILEQDDNFYSVGRIRVFPESDIFSIVYD